MRRVLLAAIGLALVAGLAWAQAIPGGHEAFLYWWNGTRWTPVQTSEPVPVSGTFTPSTSGGLSVFSAIVPNNTTSFVIKANPGQLYGLDGFSIAATTPVWLKTYDAAQGSVTCGSGTPKARYLIPASGGAPGSGLIPSSALGDAYGTAITGCITAGIADNDTTAPAASSYTLNVHYK